MNPMCHVNDTYLINIAFQLTTFSNTEEDDQARTEAKGLNTNGISQFQHNDRQFGEFEK
jgi:hypothetical protein